MKTFRQVNYDDKLYGLAYTTISGMVYVDMISLKIVKIKSRQDGTPVEVSTKKFDFSFNTKYLDKSVMYDTYFIDQSIFLERYHTMKNYIRKLIKDRLGIKGRVKAMQEMESMDNMVKNAIKSNIDLNLRTRIYLI